MAKVDPNLRKVLDTLSEAGMEHPSQDTEVLRSILDRLAPERKVRAERGAPPLKMPLGDETERLRAERDALAARQAELEARVAKLEAEENTGGLTLMAGEPDAEVIAFERVDLSGLEAAAEDAAAEEDLLEFEPIAAATPSWADDDAAWKEGGEPWEDPAAWGEAPDVEWDEEVPGVAGEATTETYDEDEGGPVWEAPTEGPTDVWQGGAETPHDAQSGGPEDAMWGELDDQTQADLRELEAQLASLEAEMERHKAEEKKK